MMIHLVGQYVREVWVSGDQSVLVFVTDKCTQSWVAYRTWQDCCSETWFADIIGLQSLLDSEIIGYRKLSFPDEPGSPRSRQRYDEVYGERLTTEKGDCDIIYRNSSNGYYCGGADVARELCSPPPPTWRWPASDWAADNAQHTEEVVLTWGRMVSELGLVKIEGDEWSA
jgi:hypothetical protein